MTLSGSSRDVAETAAHQVVGLGYRIEDVGHIVQTHLHLDHAGGLPDFPHAKVLVHKLELEAAMQRKSFRDLFYLPAHWAHGPQWVTHQPTGQKWFGFEALRVLEGISPEIWLVPLPGHTRGHCGVAVRQEDGWLLHCGDAYISRSDIDPFGSPRAKPHWMKPLAARLFPHAPRLRALLEEHGDEIEIFCSHDPDELARLQS